MQPETLSSTKFLKLEIYSSFKGILFVISNENKSGKFNNEVLIL
jgi:hypothetical protein